jgi:membrane associated rhomboid family serine protease
MIPLGDVDRRLLRFPIATALIILANAAVFVLELAGGDAFINRWSLVPADVTAGRNMVTILTAMFLHAGLVHILGNMVFLWVFGLEIEDVMGAFLITYPRDRIRTVLLFGWFARVTFVPAIILVGFWFLTQVFSEVGALATVQAGGVAYMAHIGGFVFGALLAPLFETRERRAQQGLE